MRKHVIDESFYKQGFKHYKLDDVLTQESPVVAKYGGKKGVG